MELTVFNRNGSRRILFAKETRRIPETDRINLLILFYSYFIFEYCILFANEFLRAPFHSEETASGLFNKTILFFLCVLSVLRGEFLFSVGGRYIGR